MKTNNTTKTRKDVHAEITARIVEAMQRDGVTFRDVIAKAATARQSYVSHRTGEQYSLLNSIMLLLSGKRPGEFATFKQVKDAGGNVKKGSHAAPIYFYTFVEKELTDAAGNPMTDETGAPMVKKYPILKCYGVFNVADDCEGLTPKHTADAPSTPSTNELPDADAAMQRAKEIAEAYLQPCNDFGPSLVVTAVNNPFYQQDADQITMPEMSQYPDAAYFWANLFHEMTHSTGHAARLNRPTLTSTAAAGDDYSREELIAEIGAAYLCGHAGIRTNELTDQSAAYIAGWIKYLTDHPREFATACNAADKAVSYILD